jgi:hypothetical protein
MNIHLKTLFALIFFFSIAETSYSIPQRVGVCCSRRCSRISDRRNVWENLKAVANRFFFWTATLGTELFTEVREACCMPVVLEQICEGADENAEVFDLVFVAQEIHPLTQALELPFFLREREDDLPHRTIHEYPRCTTCNTFWMKASCGYLLVKSQKKSRHGLRILELIQKVPTKKTVPGEGLTNPAVIKTKK